MKWYEAFFHGKKKNAIGQSGMFCTQVSGKDEEEARLNLYKEFDHVSNLTLKEMKEES